MDSPNVLITDKEISSSSLKSGNAQHPSCGATLTFEGAVRDHSDGKKVEGIEYECFEKMAVKEIQKIVNQAQEKWGIHQINLAHRYGKLAIGEVSLAIVIQSSHRNEAFEAMQYIINELKKRAPIWKKEFYVDGEEKWIKCSCASGGTE